MKRNDLLSALLDFVLACAMTVVGLGMLITAFDLQVDMTVTVITTAIFAAVSVLCCRLRWGGVLLLLVLAGSGYVFYDQDIQSNFFSMCNHIMLIYDQGYDWGIIESLLEYEQRDLTLTFQALSACCAVISAVGLSKCIHSMAAMAVILPVIPCVVVTDTVPDASYLLMAIVLLCLLGVTHYARRIDARQANRLTALLMIPLLLTGIFLFQWTPQNQYVIPENGPGMQAFVEKLAEYFPFLSIEVVPQDTIQPGAVDLGNLGPRQTSNRKELEVIVSRSGLVYLRRSSYMHYTGKAWDTDDQDISIVRPGTGYLEDKSRSIQIKVLESLSIRYVPYYPPEGMNLYNGAVLNNNQDSYNYTFRFLRTDWQKMWLQRYNSMGVDNEKYASMQQYLQLPEGTAERAQAYLRKAGVDLDGNLISIVNHIAEYVENCAEYDVQTQAMSGSESDFALWFLEKSETGYCVHFATATTVLLRAAGIPARYVEGYLFYAEANQTLDVRDTNAHAWVEYYVPNVGWVVLETTPEAGLPEVPTTEPPETEPTDPTKPPETEPTGPTESTEPTNPATTVPGSAPTTLPAQTQPASTAASGGGNGGNLGWMLRILQIVLWVLAALALVIGQWWLRLQLRRKAMAGRDFKAVYRRWRYSCMLAGLCRHKPPKPLLDLLKKAKFSRDGLDERELKQFERYWAVCIGGLKRRCWLLRMGIRLIWAAW